MPSQSTANKPPTASQSRRDALHRMTTDSGTAAVISKSLASIMQRSENVLFRRTCVEVLRRWGSPADASVPPPSQLSGSRNKRTVGKPVVDEVLLRLHQTFVGAVKQTD